MFENSIYKIPGNEKPERVAGWIERFKSGFGWGIN